MDGLATRLPSTSSLQIIQSERSLHAQRRNEVWKRFFEGPSSDVVLCRLTRKLLMRRNHLKTAVNFVGTILLPVAQFGGVSTRLLFTCVPEERRSHSYPCNALEQAAWKGYVSK